MIYTSERDVGIFGNDIDEKIEYGEYMNREKKSSESSEIDLKEEKEIIQIFNTK